MSFILGTVLLRPDSITNWMKLVSRSVAASVLVLLVSMVAVGAEEGSSEESVELTYRDVIQRLDPMETEGLDPELARVLGSYYRDSFGGPENYAKVESMRFEGILRMPQGALHFVAFKKKPDYCKIVIEGAGGAHLVMAYDGFDAWQLVSAESPEPTEMPPGEALNFIRDASFGGRLMYPTLPGKTIEYSTNTVENRPCYDLKVTMPDGQQLHYVVDIAERKERQQILTNAVTGDTEVISQSDFRDIEGITVPFKSVMTSNGEFVNEVRLLSVEANLGVMPWMFSRPSGDYIPRAKSPAVSSESLSTSISGTSPSPAVEWTPSGSFEAPATVFPDLSEEEIHSILDDAGIKPAK